MKITKIVCKSHIASHSTDSQHQKSSKSGSKRPNYQLRKNVKPFDISLQVLNRTNLIPTSVTERIFKQYNKAKKYNMLEEFITESNGINQNVQDEKHNQDKKYKTLRSYNKTKEMYSSRIQKDGIQLPFQKNMRSSSSQSRSHRHNINPYTHQQYIYFRKDSKKSSQKNRKIKRIKDITRPCFISGIQLTQRIPIPKTDLLNTPRPKSFNQLLRKKISQNQPSRLSLAGQDYIQPWDINENLQNSMINPQK